MTDYKFEVTDLMPDDSELLESLDKSKTFGSINESVEFTPIGSIQYDWIHDKITQELTSAMNELLRMIPSGRDVLSSKIDVYIDRYCIDD